MITLFRLLAHASLLIHMGNDVKGIADNLIQHKEKFPSAEEFKAFIGDALEFLASGLIYLPDDVTKQMTDGLTAVKDQLSKPAA